MPTGMQALVNGLFSAKRRYIVFSVIMPDASAAQNVTNLRAAIETARQSSNGATILLGAGTFDINDTIEAHNFYGLRLIGVGGATILNWTGNDASKPVLKLSNCQRCYVADLQINTASAAYCGIQQLRDSAGAGAVTPMRNHYERIDIFCNNVTSTAIYIGGTGMIDANNDFALFVNCKLQDYSSEGWFIAGSQSYGNEMQHCYSRGGVTGKYAVYAPDGNGNFLWHGGFVGQHKNADFYIGRSYQPYLIEGVNSEGSARLLEVPTGAYRTVTLRNIRWAGNGLHADRKAITTTARINLLIEQCELGDASGNVPLTLEFLRSSDGDGTGSLVMIGNRIYSTAVSVFVADKPGMLYGNVKITNEQQLTMEALVA